VDLANDKMPPRNIIPHYQTQLIHGNPAKNHYEALKQVSQFLAQMQDNGLYFWRDEPRMDLPEGTSLSHNMTTISSHITVHHNQLPNIASLC
jgi:hypothetical protein